MLSICIPKKYETQSAKKNRIIMMRLITFEALEGSKRQAQIINFNKFSNKKSTFL
jgi:hypothetical protein